MSVNKYLPHVLVLPEDDANMRVAIGFLLHASVKTRLVQVLPPAGGWLSVVSEFERTHRIELERYPLRHMVLVLDMDEQSQRLGDVHKSIPSSLKNRVFVVGAWSEPEALKGEFGGYEQLGLRLAEGCRDASVVPNAWEHTLLRHNQAEVCRMRDQLVPIVFQ